MYCYLWYFRVKYSENFESEICTKFTKNFENILVNYEEDFQKVKKIFWRINKILCSLEQISEKFIGNI